MKQPAGMAAGAVKAQRMDSMAYQHIADYCFEEHTDGHGASHAAVDALLARLAPDCKALAARTNLLAAPILDVVFRDDDLTQIETLATAIRKRFNRVVVAGTGGSGLSGRTLVQMRPAQPGLCFNFLENIDPDGMEEILAIADCETTCFLVISKSGSTVETLSQHYVLLDHVRRKLGPKAAAERFFVITVPGASPLRRSAQEHGLTILDHEPDIGGRFSILSKVGLLPAAIAGLDIRALRRGAQGVVAQLDDPAHCRPAMGAALQYAFIEKNYPISVMLPYSERLNAFGMWYRQCWAESLGKKGRGSTPVPATGTTDQHSQLQLYLDGPRDKLFTLILLNRAGLGPRIPVPAGNELGYMQGKTMGDIMAAEQKATFETLQRNHRPVRLFMLERLSEESMGALLMHFMLEIMLTASLLGVNAFDQPAVEQGKDLAREYLLKGEL